MRRWHRARLAISRARKAPVRSDELPYRISSSARVLQELLHECALVVGCEGVADPLLGEPRGLARQLGANAGERATTFLLGKERSVGDPTLAGIFGLRGQAFALSGCDRHQILPQTVRLGLQRGEASFLGGQVLLGARQRRASVGFG